VQRWQILLLGLGLLGLLAGAFWDPALWLALSALIAFYMIDASFLAHIARENAAWLAIAPLMLFLRAGALGFGLAAGLVLAPHRRTRPVVGLSPFKRGTKRTLDLLGAVLGLVLASPVLILAALAIKLDDGGPIFFTQTRIGEHGRPFRMFKLRTMIPEAEARLDEILKKNPLDGPVFKIPDDPRVTLVGRFLRRWSLDEIPQLWNVLRGDMSLVGPRPEEQWVVAQYSDEQRQRLAVKPGLTGPMQVSGRGVLDMDERLALELDYIKNYSLARDLSILLRTIPAVLRAEGAF
jgi:lipopolysaccharide/colanic/teichoic acid biosynthesis glycosyltransferase